MKLQIKKMKSIFTLFLVSLLAISSVMADEIVVGEVEDEEISCSAVSNDQIVDKGNGTSTNSDITEDVRSATETY